jgi:hypothetical protein
MLLHGASLFREKVVDLVQAQRNLHGVLSVLPTTPFRFCLNFQIFCAEMGSRAAVKRIKAGRRS